MDKREPAKPRVSLELLELLDRVARDGTISAAARSLNLSPSLATRKVAALERAMKARLFQRTTRRVRLTEAGAVALEWARQVLAGYEQLSDDLGTLQGEPSGTIRLALNEYVATVLLPPFLATFAQRYPEIRYIITNTDALVDPSEGGYDVAVHSGHIPDSSVVGIRLRAVQRILCAAPAYLDRRGRPTQLEQLAHHNCLVHTPTEPGNWFFRRGKRLIGQSINQTIVADSYLPLMEFARRGLGIIRVSRDAVQADLKAGKLVQVLSEYQCVYPTGELPGIWILYPNRRLLHRTRVFVDALSDYVRERRSAA
jgi:LysR family transcriptional activator of dmlA